MHTWRRTLRAIAATAALTAGLGVVVVTVAAAPSAASPAAPPAVAADQRTLVRPTTWAYTDSRSPTRSFVDPAGDLPVGAWRDDRDRKHQSKAYFTFDLTALRGAHIVSAEVAAGETAANDCAKPRATELWITDTATRPTWRHQPREHTKLSGPGSLPGCIWSYLDWDALPAVQRALASNSGTVTLALRMSGSRQEDVRYGRRYESDLSISIEYNFPPLTPTDLAIGLRPCTAQPQYYPSLRPELRARLTDFDPIGGGHDLLTGRFAIWPVDQPAERTELTTSHHSSGSIARRQVPAGLLVDDTEYAWSVQAVDDRGVSPWSEPCRFVPDAVRPPMPGVSSPTYPEDGQGGGPGVPGEFVFTTTASDVTGFEYSFDWSSPEFAPVGVDGTATITFTPESSRPYGLRVHAVDRAGNPSDTRDYRFFVRSTSPRVDCVPYDAPLGEPRQCTFTPGMDGVVSYTYSLGGGEEFTVPAGADGTATVSVTPPSGSSVLSVWSTTAGGVVSRPGRFFFDLRTEPSIDCSGDPYAGEPLDCVLTPVGMAGVTEYVYTVNGGPELTVAADADGTGRIVVMLDAPGANELLVVAHTGTGLRSDPASYSIYLSTEPVVTNAVYPEGEFGGGVGVPGEFVVTPGRLRGITEYVYSLDFGEEFVVPADANGGAVIPFTPDHAGWYWLGVTARTADGIRSDLRYYVFGVAG